MTRPVSDAPPLETWEGRAAADWSSAWGIPQLLAFREAGSTNDVIRDAARAGAPAGTTAIADFQARGRGRLGREWSAPPGRALLCSVLLRPAPGPHPDAAGVLPIRIGLAIAIAIERLASARPLVKWPNDLILDGRKVAGILCEATADFVVAGIGINLTQHETDFPPELRSQATSVLLATGAAPARPALAATLLQLLAPLFTAAHRPLDAGELERFERHDALAGRSISVDDVPVGMAAGIDPRGALRVRTDDAERLVTAGTVRSLS